jgi:glycyl-tRNA synthetase beta chain
VQAPLLIELLTEELPPKSLRRLQDAFASEIANELSRQHLAGAAMPKAFATPRRLAVLIEGVAGKGADSEQSVDGPQASNAKAVEGFARKHKLEPKDLQKKQTPKGEIVVANFTLPGVALDAVLSDIVDKAIRKLPIAKVMRWGAGEAQFVRPVHGLVMLHGERVVPGSVLGMASGRTTRGHRFMSTGEIGLANATEYEHKLKTASVVADFAVRRGEIEAALQAEAAKLGARLGGYEDLLDEVTALVEWPSIYAGGFDAAFLEVPHECLTLTMRQNQKYFPLFDASGQLLPKFLIVSNMQVADARNIVAGNQRVVRPRLEDARFFYNQDRKARLEARVPQLAKVVYHAKLGSQLERVERLQLLAGQIARALKADHVLIERAAWLAKADLLTGMVGEFPELQGVMGRYYAAHDGEPREVAQAIEEHYLPRFAGDRLPQSVAGAAVALADKLDAVAGLFSIGQHPTGEKDPFGLRRAALGVVRILVEQRLALSLHELARAALAPFGSQAAQALEDFIYDRFASYLKELGFSALQIDSVLSGRPSSLHLVIRQLEAVKAFQSLPEAESLVAANKRVANILRQAEAKGETLADAESGVLKEPAETALLEAIRSTSKTAKALYERGDYTGYLKSFAVLKAPVDTFFDKVMVMVDDEKLRRGRLALLRDLREAMNRVADISKLAA